MNKKIIACVAIELCDRCLGRFDSTVIKCNYSTCTQTHTQTNAHLLMHICKRIHIISNLCSIKLFVFRISVFILEHSNQETQLLRFQYFIFKRKNMNRANIISKLYTLSISQSVLKRAKYVVLTKQYSFYHFQGVLIIL